jgi:hypothetical protein
LGDKISRVFAEPVGLKVMALSTFEDYVLSLHKSQARQLSYELIPYVRPVFPVGIQYANAKYLCCSFRGQWHEGINRSGNARAPAEQRVAGPIK